jgi:type III pantothenate kinase
MASGVPLVGTTVGGIPEIVIDGVTGTLVPPRDPAALAFALERLLRNADARRAMGARARERVIREFSWHAVARRSATVYEAAAAVFRTSSEGSGGRLHSDAHLAS